jgi:cytolethal distending toxin subunit A
LTAEGTAPHFSNVFDPNSFEDTAMKMSSLLRRFPTFITAALFATFPLQVSRADDPVSLVNVKTNKCLTIEGGTSSANNLRAVQFDCDLDLSRKWAMRNAGGGLIEIVNSKTGKCLTIAGGTSTANNVTAVQFDCDHDLSRRWRTISFGDKFQLQNAKTLKCLTIAGGTSSNDNLEAVQFNCDADPSRKWRSTQVSTF